MTAIILAEDQDVADRFCRAAAIAAQPMVEQLDDLLKHRGQRAQVAVVEGWQKAWPSAEDVRIVRETLQHQKAIGHWAVIYVRPSAVM